MTTPEALSDDAARLYDVITSDYDLTDAELAVLTEGLRSFDRAEEARRIVDREGSIVRDRFGQSVRHPAVIVERDARRDFIAALVRLGVAGKYEQERQQ